MNALRTLFILPLLSMVLAVPIHAAPRMEEGASMLQTGGVSLEQAVSMVQARYGAKVMRANTVEEDGRVVHYIRLISADRSRVWTVRVDAATGREF